jgi:hypothetical protein
MPGFFAGLAEAGDKSPKVVDKKGKWSINPQKWLIKCSKWSINYQALKKGN